MPSWSVYSRTRSLDRRDTTENPQAPLVPGRVFDISEGGTVAMFRLNCEETRPVRTGRCMSDVVVGPDLHLLPP